MNFHLEINLHKVNSVKVSVSELELVKDASDGIMSNLLSNSEVVVVLFSRHEKVQKMAKKIQLMLRYSKLS